MSDSNLPPAASTSSETTPPPRKKKRLWLKVLLALIVIIILLVALAPTIISTGAVKSVVVSQINKNLNGHVEIDSWSLGWTSGIHVNGVKVFDDTNAQIAEMKSFDTDLALIGAARGNIALGNTVVDSPKFDAKIDKNGKSNFEKLVKSSPEAPKTESPKPDSSPKPAGEPAKMPKVSGTLKLVNGSGTVTQEGQPQTLFITAIDGDVNIADLNQPIDHNLTVAMKVGYEGAPGKLTVKGKAAAIKNDVVDMKTANVEEAITLDAIDLPGLAPFIPPSVGISPKSGVINGQLALAVKDGRTATLSGQIDGKAIHLTGPALKDDTYITNALQVAISTITVNMPNGMDDVNAMTVKAEKPIAVTWDQGSVTADVDMPLSAVMNLADRKPPGAAGKANVGAKVDIAAIIKMLPHLVPVPEGTQIATANLTEAIDLTITPDAANFSVKTDVANVAGTNKGKPISVKPINVTLTGQARGSNQQLPDLRDLKLTLASGFADANFSAATISQLTGEAHADLAKLQAELGQIVDFKNHTLAGAFAMTVNTTADPQDLSKPAMLKATASLSNIKVTDDKGQVIEQKWLQADVKNATLHATKEGALQSVDQVTVTVLSDDANNPTIDVLLDNVAVNFTNGLSATWDLKKLNLVLSTLQQELGSFVPALKDAGPLDLGTLAITSQGSLQQAKDVTTVKITSLSVTESKGLFSVTQAGELSVKVAGDQVQPAGKVQIAADLVKLSDIIQKISKNQATVATNASPQKINSGKLAGTVELATIDASNISVAVDMTATDVSLDTKGGASERQTITFGLKTTPAADFSSIKNTSLYAKSAFMDVSATDVAVDLPKAAPNSTGVALPVVRSAKIALNVSDVGPIQTLMNAFAPPANDPANPPLSITSGQLKMTGNVSHEGTATVITLSEISGKDLILQKGTANKKLKPFDVNLVAKVDITGDTTQTLAQQLREISVTRLTGHLGIAELTMPEPLKITSPLGTMAAAGAIAITGQAKDLTTLAEALAGKQPGELYPYSGQYTARLNLSTSGNTVTLKGPIEVVEFVMLDKSGQPLVQEPKIAIAVDVNADTVAHNAKINSLNIDMPSSGALVLKVTGGITDWETKRQIDSMKVLFAGDWDKLWPMAKPLLSPDLQAQVADLKLSGKFERSFNVAGSYPAGMEMAQAIKLLTADGSVAIASADWPSMGIVASNLEVPIFL